MNDHLIFFTSEIGFIHRIAHVSIVTTHSTTVSYIGGLLHAFICNLCLWYFP